MVASDPNKIIQSIQSAPFLSDLEKELLLGILPQWPKELLNDFYEAMKFSPLAGVMDPEHQLPPPHARAHPVEHYVMARPQAKPLAPPMPQTPSAPPKPQSNLQDILKRMETETINFRNAGGGRVGPGQGISERPHLVEVLPPRPQAPPVPAKISPPVKIAGKPLVQMQTLADLAQITLNHVVKSLNMSPLHKLFVRTGLALMDDTAKDRNEAFARVAQTMQNQFGSGFTQKEFESYTDFRDELEELM